MQHGVSSNIQEKFQNHNSQAQHFLFQNAELSMLMLGLLSDLASQPDCEDKEISAHKAHIKIFNYRNGMHIFQPKVYVLIISNQMVSREGASKSGVYIIKQYKLESLKNMVMWYYEVEFSPSFLPPELFSMPL